jgi:hypothetical protein
MNRDNENKHKDEGLLRRHLVLPLFLGDELVGGGRQQFVAGCLKLQKAKN